jgi:hypothetical protein
MASSEVPGQISIRLTPDALGRVDITISRPPDGTARIALSVERPETLAALRSDQTSLHQALDRAGIPPESRMVTIELATRLDAMAQAAVSQTAPDPTLRQPAPGAHTGQAGFDPGMAQTGTSGGPFQGGQSGTSFSGQGGGSWGRPEQARPGADEDSGRASPPPASQTGRTGWLRAGINFTA